MLANKRINNVIVNRNYNKNGDVLTCEWYNSAFHDEQGNLISVYSLIHDISDRIRDELRLQKYTSELKELNATKDKFFSIIAHDLRSPFQVLIGYSDFLSEEYSKLSEEQKLRYIGEIEKMSRSTFQLLENLLEWSRIQIGKMNIVPEKFDFWVKLNPTLLLLKQTALSKKINFNYSIDGSLVVNADKNTIDTVIRNLVSYAIKFTKPSGTIKLFAKSINDYAVISVEDTGVGIDQQHLNRLFNLDSHITTLGTEEEKGTGLGLVLCKEMIEKNGGEIWAKSEKGKGTIFSFTIPI